MNNSIRRFATWSNAFYLVPLAAAWVSGLWYMAAALSLLFITSTAYHLSGEQRFVKTDILSAYLVIFLNLYLLISSGLPLRETVFAVVFVGIALYFRYIGEKRSFDLNHGLWHVSCAIVTLTCVLSHTLPF